MTGEIKDEMCGRNNCEICLLLNELFKEPLNEIKPISEKFSKYARLYYH